LPVSAIPPLKVISVVLGSGYGTLPVQHGRPTIKSVGAPGRAVNICIDSSLHYRIESIAVAGVEDKPVNPNVADFLTVRGGTRSIGERQVGLCHSVVAHDQVLPAMASAALISETSTIHQAACKVMGDGSNKLIHVIHGKWSTGSLKQANFVKFKVVNVLYGDVKGEGQEEAWVNLGP
jgi:hypothetical protein